MRRRPSPPLLVRRIVLPAPTVRRRRFSLVAIPFILLRPRELCSQLGDFVVAAAQARVKNAALVGMAICLSLRVPAIFVSLSVPAISLLFQIVLRRP